MSSHVQPASGLTDDSDTFRQSKVLVFVSLAMAVASLVAGWIMPINDDDVFYLHTWWLYGQGYVAHRDFLGGLPGLWLLLAPAAWLPWTPSGFAAFGRALVAGTFGLSFYLVGRLVRAYRWEALLLAAMALVVMIRTEWFLFRRAYFEGLFLALHLWLLAQLPETKRPGLLSGLAGWCVGMICMISQRGAFYLHLQPIFMLWAFWGRWRLLGRAALAWMLGGLLAAVPTACYLTLHHLWREEWAWIVEFPRQTPFTKPMWLNPKTALWILIGMVGLLGVSYDRRLTRHAKQFLWIAWLGLLAAMVLNLTPLHYTETIFQLLTGAMWAVAGRTLVDRIPPPPVLQKAAAAALTGLAALGAYGLVQKACLPAPWNVPYQVRQQQNAVLDWLGQLCQEDRTLAIDPYHPILAPNATFLRGAWQYRYFLRHPMLRERLANFGQQVLQTRPAVISAKPWPELTAGHDMIGWLRHQDILSQAEADALGQMIRQDYIEIQFPGIRWGPLPSAGKQPNLPSRAYCYGDTFWIRRDRFQACPPPDIEYIVREPQTEN